MNRFEVSRAGNMVLIVMLVCCVGTTRGDVVSLLDENLSDGDWSRQVLVDTFGISSSESAGQQTTGGAPDAFRQSRMTGMGQIVFGELAPQMEIGHFGTAATWDPGTMGSINDLAISYDAVALDDRPPGQTLPTGRSVRFGFVVRQSDIVYRPISNPLATHALDDTWSMHSVSALEGTDFEPYAGGAGTPDFSTGGDPLEFGYVVLMSSTSGTINNEMGVDNFRVTVGFNPIPEPTTQLLATSVLGMSLVLRQRCTPRCYSEIGSLE